MELEDDTTVLATLKSYQSFISMPETQQRVAKPNPGLHTQYLRSMEGVQDDRSLQGVQEEQENRSLKRARLELEEAACVSARQLEQEVERNRELLGRIRRLEERVDEAARSQSEQEGARRSLRSNLEAVNRRLADRDAQLSSAQQTVSSQNDEIRDLKQQLQTQENIVSTHTLEQQAVQQQLDLQRRKYQEMSQRCQELQEAQSSCSDQEMKIKELQRHLELQDQDSLIVQNMRSEVARVPDLDKELRALRQENTYLREWRESSGLLQEEVEGLRRKVERMEKMKEEVVTLELEREKLLQSVQAWEKLGQTTGLDIRKPDDLSREVILIQQREITLKQQNYTLTSSVRAAERSRASLQGELALQSCRLQEEQNKTQTQEALGRRLQKRLLLLTKERDGLRGILESYDSELGSDYTPLLGRRLREAEEGQARSQGLLAQLEVQLNAAQEETGAVKRQLQSVELELEMLKKQQASVAEGNPLVTTEEVNALRLKVEELEAERQRLEEQNSTLEMRLDRQLLQGDYDPVKTKVVHLRLNPTSVAKQLRQEEVEVLRQEVTRLREHLRSLASPAPDASASNVSISLPPSQEVLELRRQMESSELKNQRLKEVFQKKIQEFRTVCYVLTGYQIDLTTHNQYRLSSVYAEHMDDALLFKSAGGSVGGSVGAGAMQLMETSFSRTLAPMVDLHLHHQKSIPAFLSAVTLDLFSRQTSV
ncbi:mitotic spindle assembly checkpoint protein MAD1 isoform X2 [Hypomesus transpacificus]|uniref:mitotic spindle assembly checkpoint protein MAD1 isoform X2 n=1 Tax=Hypomesus transpacificus TaxID=137520 RepID=UPI001F07448B|nr:mitotic spindle assembly checkpoint protein MAD1 isoform X2 [Hypomesus transpacificus]